MSLPYLSHMSQNLLSLKTFVQMGGLKSSFLHWDILIIEVIHDDLAANSKEMLAAPLIMAALYQECLCLKTNYYSRNLMLLS